ncbi:hypothetical protein fugu_011126, partial [Takifugu bimaculatus]
MNDAYRSMHRGEEARLRGGGLARERRHLALCINNQDEVKRYHHYCSHGGGQAAPGVERCHPWRSEDEDDNSPLRVEQQRHLEVNAIVIQRAWRASASRRASWQGQEKNGSEGLDEMLLCEDLRAPAMTADIPPELLKKLQNDFKCIDGGGFQLQSHHLSVELDNEPNINLPAFESQVSTIQRAWRDFLQRQEVEKRSPSPPSLSSSSDKMSTSISMMTLSDGSTP